MLSRFKDGALEKVQNAWSWPRNRTSRHHGTGRVQPRSFFRELLISPSSQQIPLHTLEWERFTTGTHPYRLGGFANKLSQRPFALGIDLSTAKVAVGLALPVTRRGCPAAGLQQKTGVGEPACWWLVTSSGLLESSRPPWSGRNSCALGAFSGS